jgi:O-antigen ligase
LRRLKAQTSAISALWIAVALSFPVTALFEDSATWLPAIPGAALLALAVFAAALMQGTERTALLISMVSSALFLGSLAFFTRDGSDLEKITQFSLVFIVFGVLTGTALANPFVFRRATIGLTLCGAVAGSVLLLSPGYYQAGRLTFGENNPIWMARAVALLGIGAFGIFLENTRRWPISLAAIGVAFVGVVMTGSRGPLFGMICAIATGALFFRFRSKARYLFIGLWLVAMLLTAASYMNWVQDLRGLSLSADGGTSRIRQSMWAYTVDLISHHPEGIGIGWFRYAEHIYPHNIFLEFAVEWGLIPGIAIAGWIVTGIAGVFRLPREASVLKLLAVFELLNASVSGDITTPRFLYGLVILGNAVHLAAAMKKMPATKFVNRAAARTQTRAVP